MGLGSNTAIIAALLGWGAAAFAQGVAGPLEFQPASEAVSCLRDEATRRCTLQSEGDLKYPRSAVRLDKLHGTVLVRMDFTGPSQPPQATLLFSEGGPAFTEAVGRYLANSRLPCLAETQQVTSVEAFQFRMEESPALSLPDMSLAEFIPLIDGIEKESVLFDFTAMGCPFDLRLRSYRPWASNVVREAGSGDPRRGEFMAWLSGVVLKLPAQARGRLIGQEMGLSVPCTQLDLR